MRLDCTLTYMYMYVSHLQHGRGVPRQTALFIRSALPHACRFVQLLSGLRVAAGAHRIRYNMHTVLWLTLGLREGIAHGIFASFCPFLLKHIFLTFILEANFFCFITRIPAFVFEAIWFITLILSEVNVCICEKYQCAAPVREINCKLQSLNYLPSTRARSIQA